MRSRKLATFLSRLVSLCGLLAIFVGCAAPTPSPQAAASDTPIPPTAVTIVPATAAATLEPSAPPAVELLLFDDDGSRDGMAALLYLLEHREISLQAVTISYGEAHPDVYVQHVGRVLDHFGYGAIPLGAGQDAPLAEATAFPDFLRDLSDSYWGLSVPNQGKTYSVQEAPELIVSTLQQAPQPITIFVSGTFTNLAQALQLDPSIKDKIAAVYFMGGAVNVPGNITNLINDSSNHAAEWNIYADPQAASQVFNSGLALYMIPLDATNAVLLKQEEIRAWQAGGPKAAHVVELYDIMFNQYGFEKVEVFDLTAAALMVRPDLCAFEPLRLEVVTDGGDNQGQTAPVEGGQPNAYVCLEPEVEGLKQELHDSFTGISEPYPFIPIDPVAGSWVGTIENDGLEMQISLTIEASCQLGEVCGRFDIASVGCSGTLSWVGMEGEMYQFEAGDKTEACGEGQDYLVPQPDGSVLYISRGDYGESQGILSRQE